MYQNNKVLCTICARKGSKGVPNKNKILVDGKPLIVYTLELVKQCDYLDRMIVSTDDEEIIKISETSGIPAPFVRPEHLCKDNISRTDAILHATDYAEKYWKEKYDIIIDLGVTSPLRNLDDIKNSIELLVKEKADNVISVSPSYRSPYFNMIEIVEGKVRLVKTKKKNICGRQEAPTTYDMNDSINVWWRKTLFEKNASFNDNTKIYVMPRERGLDIDEPFDLLVFSLLIKHRNDKGAN